MNITLTPEVERLVRERVEKGDYENADILVQAAVNRLLQEDHAEREGTAIWEVRSGAIAP